MELSELLATLQNWLDENPTTELCIDKSTQGKYRMRTRGKIEIRLVALGESPRSLADALSLLVGALRPDLHNPWPEKEDTQPNLDPNWPQAAGQGYPALELFSQTSDFQMPEVEEFESVADFPKDLFRPKVPDFAANLIGVKLKKGGES
jgi:hypothetical protein